MSRKYNIQDRIIVDFRLVIYARNRGEGGVISNKSREIIFIDSYFRKVWNIFMDNCFGEDKKIIKRLLYFVIIFFFNK